MNIRNFGGDYLVTLMLIMVGVIHLLPMAGMLGDERLSMLYGVQITDPNLEILMRHRASLFGVLGGFLLCAAFRPPLRALALIGGFVSVASFLLLALTVGDYNALVGRVITADFVALGCLALASCAHRWRRQ